MKVARPIVLRDFKKNATGCRAANSGLVIGANNPVREPFDFIAEGSTTLDPSATTIIGDATRVTLRVTRGIGTIIKIL